MVLSPCASSYVLSWLTFHRREKPYKAALRTQILHDHLQYDQEHEVYLVLLSGLLSVLVVHTLHQILLELPSKEGPDSRHGMKE